MSETAKGLAGLTVWQKSIELAEKIHKELLPHLPIEEKWALASQLRRSSQSISANIAEGYGRYYYQEGVRFSYIARGSLEETFRRYTEMIDELRKMIAGYIKYLKSPRLDRMNPVQQSTNKLTDTFLNRKKKRNPKVAPRNQVPNH